MKSLKSMLGVTLLEIMLVLAIAAMIIVMSIRYYQSAVSSQQVNTIMQQIQAITAAADGIAQANGGTYNGTTPVSNATLAQLLPAMSVNTTPWGTSIRVTPSTSSYTVDLGAMPSAVCAALLPRLNSNNHYNAASGCTTGADFSYTYSANP